VYERTYGKFFRVTRVARDTGNFDFGSRRPGFDYEANEVWGYETTGIGCAGLGPDHMLIIGQTAEQKEENLAKAVAYQETLTKAGTPRKRSKV